MTAFDDQLERGMGEALADIAAARTPDYINSAIARAVTHRQRRWWTFPERWLPMTVITGRRSLTPALPWRPIALLVILAMLLALVAVFAASNLIRRSADPYGLASNGSIVYAEAGDIYAADASGAIVRPLIGGLEADSAPRFSHDGTRISFVRTDGGVPYLMVANADGSNVVQLVSGATAADWSPDSRELALVQSLGGAAVLSIVTADESAAVRTISLGTVTPVDWVAWRPPKGDEILFKGVDAATAKSAIYSVRADGSDLRAIIVGKDPDPQLNFQDTDVSHDGSLIGYSNWETNAAGATDAWPHIINIDSGADTTGTEYSQPHFSPAGDLVVGEGVFQLLVGPVDGSSPARAIGPKYNGQHSAGYDFSPDGTQVLLTTETSLQTYLIDVTTGVGTRTTWGTTDFPGWQRLPR